MPPPPTSNRVKCSSFLMTQNLWSFSTSFYDNGFNYPASFLHSAFCYGLQGFTQNLYLHHSQFQVWGVLSIEEWTRCLKMFTRNLPYWSPVPPRNLPHECWCEVPWRRWRWWRWWRCNRGPVWNLPSYFLQWRRWIILTPFINQWRERAPNEQRGRFSWIASDRQKEQLSNITCDITSQFWPITISNNHLQ